MVESYKILYKGGSGELIEKKSRFIADIKPASTEEEVSEFIEEVRKKYWDARHHCYAYILGDKGQVSRMSDDGEPSQTAGKPMLEVLQGEGLHDVCAVVTRYFGGTLLGTGGLVRAYQGAVKEGLQTCVMIEKRLAQRIRVYSDYSGAGKIQYIASQAGVHTLDSQFMENCVFTFLAPVSQGGVFTAQITEGTAGKAVIEEDGQVYFGIVDGETVVF